MAKAHTQDILGLKNEVIQGALNLAADKNWSDVSLQDIAKLLSSDIEIITALFPNKNDIIAAYARQIDLRLHDEFEGQGDNSESPRDRLFDIMMERFDILNENRAAVISVINSITLNPRDALDSLSFTCRSTTTMATLAGMDVNGWKGALVITGLSGLYIKTLRDWVADDSEDMAATMASLDKGLGYLDKINM